MQRLKCYCLFFSIVSFLSIAKASDKKITFQEQQQYLMHINKALLYRADSLYQKACTEYELAFNYRKDYVIDLFECAKLYDKLNNTGKTLKYLKMSIKAGCYWYNDTNYLPNLIRINKLPSLSEYKELRKSYYKKINIDYLLELEKLVARDMTIRKDISSQITDESTMILIVDPMNMLALKDLVKKYGYPEYATVGYMGVTDAFILLMHGLLDGDSLNWVYFQPILLSEVKNGQLMPDYYALLYDRVISHNGTGGKQCYGWQRNTPIDDVENVDIRRREIGLMPLGDWLKLYGMKVPDGYIRK